MGSEKVWAVDVMGCEEQVRTGETHKEYEEKVIVSGGRR